MDESFDVLENKLEAVHEQTTQLTEFRTETKMEIESLSQDVKFIKHKLHEIEVDVFNIRYHLKLVK